MRVSTTVAPEFDPSAGLISPDVVITEVTYLIGTRLGVDAEVRFLGDLAAGDFTIEAVMASDWLRIAELASRYRDLPLGTVDGSVVAAAERLRITKIATLDRWHFSVVRPAHTDAFELVPRDLQSRRSLA